MQRRTVLTAAVGLVALVSGAWWAQRRSAQSDLQAAGATLESEVWSANFPDLQGQPTTLGGWQGKIMLINFWATWCPPCIEEMPLLQRMYTQVKDKNAIIVGIAVDNAPKVQDFVLKNQISFPILASGMHGLELATVMGNTSKTLPFSVLVHADGSIVQRKSGQLSEDELRKWLDIAS